ncbi:hypothetical protein [Mycolicibacterium sp. NCC-Tsukiji]|nr:hypothetical protein [Mycolicibacterium sp. NCC-Tsukiji]
MQHSTVQDSSRPDLDNISVAAQRVATLLALGTIGCELAIYSLDKSLSA